MNRGSLKTILANNSRLFYLGLCFAMCCTLYGASWPGSSIKIVDEELCVEASKTEIVMVFRNNLVR